jgi:magnesium transporter
VHTGERKAPGVSVIAMDYDANQVTVKEVRKLGELARFRDSEPTTWIDIIGLHEVEVIEQIGAHVGLHPLIMEDILDTNQRPKMEDLGEYIFVVAKTVTCAEADGQVTLDQVSLVLGSNYVISFQERDTGLFAPIRERIKAGQGRLRNGGADYLTYRILDAVVDSYFSVVEQLEDGLEGLEDEVVANPTPETLQSIHHTKRNLIALRKAVWPLREVIGGLERRETPLIGEGIAVFMRDVYDHTVQLIDTVETLRDVVGGILDVYLSSLSNRLNEVMKVLTIISTVFMPLSFLAGVYGMNFKHFPEIEKAWGYPFLFWGLCLLMTSAMVMYFRRKRWM